MPGTAERLHKILTDERWADLPIELAQLSPRFADVRVVQFTKPASLWEGAWQKLQANGAGAAKVAEEWKFQSSSISMPPMDWVS